MSSQACSGSGITSLQQLVVLIIDLLQDFALAISLQLSYLPQCHRIVVVNLMVTFNLSLLGSCKNRMIGHWLILRDSLLNLKWNLQIAENMSES